MGDGRVGACRQLEIPVIPSAKPTFYFKIDEIEEAPHVQPPSVPIWRPSISHGDNRTVQRGVTGRYWHCGETILPVNGLPAGCFAYKVYSVYYCEAKGFWVYKGDATQPQGDQFWHDLQFDTGRDYSSYLTNAGEYATLRTQRRDQTWPRLLLPDIYHLSPDSWIPQQQYGGLVGELPIFLALMAFSIHQDNTDWVLRNCFVNGSWRVHSGAHGRRHKRGVVVYVYTCPNPSVPGAPNNENHGELQAIEDGRFGKYFY